MSESDQDWAAVLERVLNGDRLALLRVARLVSSFLVRWNAFHFREDWEDVTQEVVTIATLAVRDGKLRNPGAALGFLYSTARFKYLDRLRLHLRVQQGQGLPWAELVERGEALPDEERRALQRALGHVPDKTRRALVSVYVDGRTYEEAARETGIPLGTLKRCLREGLAQLRRELEEEG